MGSFASIAAVGKSVERLLTLAFSEQEPVAGKHTLAQLARTEDLAKPTQRTPYLSILVYRVDFNRTMRAAWSAVGNYDGRAHLPLDVHFLLTAWADSAEHELAILGRAMQCLEESPILTGPLLAPDGWTAKEAVQIVLDDLTTDTVMRIFDSLQADYKLSVPYMARVIRVDGQTVRVAPPVTQVVTEPKPEAMP